MFAFLAAILLAFPGEHARLPYVTNTYCIGAVQPHAAHDLRLDGRSVDIYRTGAFVAMAPVTSGVNVLTFTYGGETLTRRVHVAQPPAPDAAAPAPQPPRDIYADLKISPDTPPRPSPRGKRPQDLLIYVDPGHGGRDTGALTPRGWYEKDANLAQARAICAALSRAGFRTRMTRSDDTFVPLYARARMAIDDRADAFLSVHHNATHCSRDPRLARHTVTYASNTNGLALAQAVQKHMAAVLSPVADAGAQMRSYAVCRNPVVPSCLLEVDFVNLPEGEEASWDAARQKKVAQAVVLGLLDWMAP